MQYGNLPTAQAAIEYFRTLRPTDGAAVIYVAMLAFRRDGEPIEHRPVRVEFPLADTIEGQLGQVFHNGQNDFQPSNKFCSVSMGDVVHHPCGLYYCEAFGWSKIDDETYNLLTKLPGRELTSLKFRGDKSIRDACVDLYTEIHGHPPTL